MMQPAAKSGSASISAIRAKSCLFIIGSRFSRQGIGLVVLRNAADRDFVVGNAVEDARIVAIDHLPGLDACETAVQRPPVAENVECALSLEAELQTTLVEHHVEHRRIPCLTVIVQRIEGLLGQSGAAAQRGWTGQNWTDLVKLWNRESGWSWSAENVYSGAYGIPQALPGSKMATFGANWKDDAAVQIDWGLSYIAQRYGSPSAAWQHSEQTGWY